MKKHLKWVLGGLLLAIVPVFAWVSVAHAQRFSNNIEDGQKVYSNVYGTGKTVTIKGEIFGDVFCAGQSVDVEATVHGDVICAGMDLTVNGIVDGNVRLAGQNVTVGADITRNATVLSSTFSLDAGAKVGQDLTAVGGTLNIKGTITRDATVNAGAVVFNGKIGRNVIAQSQNIQLKKDAAIKGDLTYTGSQKPQLLSGATIAGKTTEHAKPAEHKRHFFSPVFYLYVLVSMLLISVVLAFLFPKLLIRNSDYIKRSFGKTLVVGLLASMLVPVLGFAFAVTIVGLPLTLFLLVATTFAILLGGPIAGYYVGRLVMRNSQNTIAIAAAGGLILVTAYFLPIVGFVFLMGAIWLGLGSLVLDVHAHSRLATGDDSRPKAKVKGNTKKSK